MTEIDKLKKEATNLIESNQLRACMNRMKEYLIDGTSQRRLLSNLLRRYNELFNERNQSVVEDTPFRTGMNQLADSLLSLIEQFSTDNVSESLFIEPILIICNANKRKEMESFFGKKYFPNAQFINYGEALPKGVFDVVFLEDESNIITQTTNRKQDGDPTEANVNRRKEMTNYLNESEGYFLYIGTFFPMHEYKNRVYYSNSRFSTYARLKEVLDYIKYYGK